MFNERAEIPLKPRHPIKRLLETTLRDNTEDAEHDKEQINPPKVMFAYNLVIYIAI